VNNFKKRVEDKHKLFELNYNALQQLDVEHIDYIQLLQLLEEAVSSLPPQCQQVFRLSRYDNLTNNEISEKLQITNKAVEANITRALKILRVKLKDYLLLLLLFKIC
jgi:RNA polymerase sigma-70 factor (ECF subfamily)